MNRYLGVLLSLLLFVFCVVVFSLAWLLFFTDLSFTHWLLICANGINVGTSFYLFLEAIVS
jgi:hypothetical protein